MHMGWGPSFHVCSIGFRSEGDPEQEDASSKKKGNNQNNPVVRFIAISKSLNSAIDLKSRAVVVAHRLRVARSDCVLPQLGFLLSCAEG